MNRWRVGEDRGSKETDGCPLTDTENYKYKGNRFKGNNNDGECHCLWIHLYWPRGVCAAGFDCVYVYRVKEASAGPPPVGVLRLSICIRPKGV
jgi:hypothetical protein